MIPRPAPARTRSLCGTARRLNAASRPVPAIKPATAPCRYAAIWTCQNSAACSKRMAAHRR